MPAIKNVSIENQTKKHILLQMIYCLLIRRPRVVIKGWTDNIYCQVNESNAK